MRYFVKFIRWIKEVVIVSFTRRWWETFECWSIRKVETDITQRTLKENEEDEERMIKASLIRLKEATYCWYWLVRRITLNTHRWDKYPSNRIWVKVKNRRIKHRVHLKQQRQTFISTWKRLRNLWVSIS